MTNRRTKGVVKPKAHAARGYVTRRDITWRYMMVAAINAGLEQGVFKLRFADDPWAINEVRTYEFALPRLPHRRAVVHARDIGHEEIALHVMVEPDAEGEELVNLGPHRVLLRNCAGAALGWLERKKGAWLQRPEGKLLLVARNWLCDSVVGIPLEPIGYADRGKCMM